MFNLEFILLSIGALRRYNDFAKKFTYPIERRLLKGEKIPADEKTYSIFKEQTEWITIGKMNKKVELGHLKLIAAEQNQLILDYIIMEGEKDTARVVPLLQRMQKTIQKRPSIATVSLEDFAVRRI